MPAAPPEVGVFTTDATLVVRVWDDWLAAVTGIAADAARGRPLAEVVPDIVRRGLLPRFQEVLASGAVHVLAPALHHYLIPCPPRTPSAHFTRMQQRVTIGPLREGDDVVGTMVTVQDVTARLDAERSLAAALRSSGSERARTPRSGHVCRAAR